MKNFFKKLSFVLAIAMVLTSLAPATASAAAKNYVAVNGKKATATYAYIGGKEVVLTPYVNGKKATKVTIENSNPEKATIDNNGVITPVANGNTIVTFKKGDKKIGTVTVKVRTRAKALNIYDRAEYKAGNKTKLTELTLKVGDKKDLQITMPLYKVSKKAGAKKASYFTYPEVDGTAVKVTKNAGQRNFTVEAVEAGTAKVTIVANQKTYKNVRDKYYVEASFDVAVKDDKLAAKQTSANVITVTGTDLSDKVADYTLKFGNGTKTLAKAEKLEDGTVLLTAGTSTLAKGTYTLTFGELSVEFECGPSEVTSIEIVPEKAILKSGSETEAVAYYVVRDQFGDDVTKKAFSDLAISGSDLDDVSKAGKVTFKTTSGKYNLNLSQVSLSIVNKTNGVVCSKVLTISENSKLSEVEFAGLYKVEGGSYKAVKSIPEGTLTAGLNNYVLLVTGKDQYGLEFPATGINKDNLSLTLSSVTGLQAQITAAGAAVTKEINDVEYFVVTLTNTSSDAATKGVRAGEVNVMGVVLTSGKTFADKFEVSNAVKIAKISISANGTVYGGQDNVLSYTVLDTEGNEIKDIDTLCQLNDTEFLKDFGKIKFVGSKDGTAVLKYTAASTTNKTMDTLSWISPTLEFGSTTLNIVPDRKAVAVVGTWSWAETGWNVGANLTTTSNGSISIPLNAYKYEDQYGDLIPWYEYDTVVSNSSITVANEFKSADLPVYVSNVVTNAGLSADAGAVTASSIQKVEVKTEVTVPGETNARKNEFSYQVAFVAIDDITGLAMGANHDTWKSIDADYPTTSSAIIGFWASGYYAGMGVDLQATDYTVIDGSYDYINPTKTGYDKTVDDSASIVVKNNLGTVLKADVKVSNERSKVVDADAYRAAFKAGYRTVTRGTAYTDFQTDVWSKTQYNEARAITPRVTFSNLPADTTKYVLTDNGTNHPSLTFTTAGWYTVKAQYNFEGFVYDAVLVFEVR